jgi:predicted porin
MRKLLLAGVALAGAAAYLPTAAQAQSPTFNTTSRPGKLDGAAPGSVQVNLGGTLFSGILFTSGTGDSGAAQTQNPNLLNYFRLYPNFNYASPSGVNYGVSAEVRSVGAPQDKGRSGNTLYWHSATGYISSDKFGKFEVGTPNDAIDQLGVGTGDDFGTGGFYSEYGWPNATNFIASDSYDGDNPHQKLAYISPDFSGFTFAVSYQPTAVGLNNSSSLLTYGSDGKASKDRVEGALQFSHAFGPTSVKADVGYAYASPDANGSTIYKDVSYVQAGAVVTFAGVELEGQVNTGAFSTAGNDAGNWGGPLAKGEKDTTAYIVGVGYTMGPYSIGAQYYHLTADASDNGGVIGKTFTGSGEALGAGYVVGPGVSTYFDAITDTNKVAGTSKNGTGIGLGVYFSW